MKEGALSSSADYKFFVGIDWATRVHEACIMDSDRSVLARLSVEHTARGIEDLVEQLMKISSAEPASVAIGIETPRGALVETLMDRGFHVYSLNPKQSDRFRDRHTVAGAKDDRLDAFVVADALRTDLPCFRRVNAEDPVVIRLREVSRVADELTEEALRLANRLREQLYRYFPQILKLSPAADEPWFWTLLSVADTPEKALRLRSSRIGRILQDHQIRRIGADDVIAAIRTPSIYVIPGTMDAAADHVRMLLPRLRLIHEQRRDCERKMRILLEQLGAEEASEGNTNEHRDVDIILSLPGVGIKTAATVLAEAHEAIINRDYHALRAHAGIAPVTRRSGTRKVVQMRRSCNERLRNALYHAARVNVQCDPASRELYAALRRRGHSHGRACRTIADRMLRILIAMLRSRQLYDKHQLPVPAGEELSNAA
jgi:transposase